MGNSSSAQTKTNAVTALAGVPRRTKTRVTMEDGPGEDEDEVLDAAPGEAPGLSKGRSSAEARMRRVLADRPWRTFGPSHVFSPNAYADVHAGGKSFEPWLSEFDSLNGPMRQSAFETFAYFQGKMGLLMRHCDTFGALDTEYGLFLKLAEISHVLFALPHLRLWRIDPSARSAIIVYHDSSADPQNGRTVPALPSSLPGDIARTRNVVALHKAFTDSRYGGCWQARARHASPRVRLMLCVPAACARARVHAGAF